MIGTALVVAVAAGGAYWLLVHKPEMDAKEAVKRLLRDPDSAQFEKLTRNESSKVWCGTVNAKNRMGGYEGYIRFMVAPDGSATLEPAKTTPSNQAADLLNQADRIIEFIAAAKRECPSLYASP
jgi:hypothetical protein